MDDKNGVMDSIGSVKKYEKRPYPFTQQQDMLARKIASRANVGNDMREIPNALNGSKHEYSHNVSSESVIKQKP